jgi:type VI secretion system protein ImpF
MTGAPRRIAASVLDRLLDPGGGIAAGAEGGQSLKELRESVRRDLEGLLNTHQRCRSWPADLTELDRSLLAYGLPDFTGTGLATRERQDAWRRSLEALIRRFEPRFRSVRIEGLDNADPLDRTLRFRIIAVINVDPAPDPIVYDSVLDPSTRNFNVTGDDG